MATPLIRCETFNALEILEARRFLSAGQLDSFFGDRGLVQYRYPLGELRAIQDMVTLRDGKILAAITTVVLPSGQADQLTETLARFNRNGSLDTSFGNGVGAINLDVPADNTARLRVQGDGKILLMARGYLTRFNADGSRDVSFGSEGSGQIFLNHHTELTLQSDDKILVGGTRRGTLSVQRFLANGTPDNSFSGDSIAMIRGAGGGVCAGVAVANNGTIYVGGVWIVKPMGENTEDAIYAYDIVQLRADGTVAKGFGTAGTGIVEQKVGVYIGMSGQLLLDAARERIIFGVLTDYTHNLHAYTGRGVRDQSFGTGGSFFAASVNPTLAIDASRLYLQGDGCVIAAGDGPGEVATPPDQPDGIVSDPALARTTSDGKADTSFGTKGVAVGHLPGLIPANNDRYTSAHAITFGLDGSLIVASRDRDGMFSMLRFWRDEGPAAEFSAAPIEISSSRSQVFNVVYRDDADVDPTTLGNRDLRVTGPDGFVTKLATSRRRATSANFALRFDVYGLNDGMSRTVIIVRLPK